MDFATRLTLLRKDMGLTQAELAKKTGISRSVLASYEATGKTPTLERMILLAKFFNVSLDYLVGISDSKNFRNSLETDELGLSEKSIELLKNSKVTGSFNYNLLKCIIYIDLINSFFENDLFTEFLQNCSSYIIEKSYGWEKYAEFFNDNIANTDFCDLDKIINVDYYKDSIDTKFVETVSKQRVFDTVIKMLDDIYENTDVCKDVIETTNEKHPIDFLIKEKDGTTVSLLDKFSQD